MNLNISRIGRTDIDRLSLQYASVEQISDKKNYNLLEEK